ncbi:hypothetical protein [Streptomyces sp. T028]|uniref:hypothetical protein n=1 Tax=Streptomyces sp. T028 TaxID=3394379 RepID=UPI003A8939F3
MDTGTPPEDAPGLPVRLPSPEMWAAILTGARRRRASRPQPSTELPVITPADIASTLVGAYVLPPEVRQRTLFVAQFTEAS